MQSYDGTIRVAPAVLETRNARFTLHAVGGFVVSGEIGEGKPLWISIESRLGNACKVANPWDTAHLFRNGTCEVTSEDPTIEFSTERGERVLLVPDREMVRRWKAEPVTYETRREPKESSSGLGLLGMPRMF